MANQLDQAENNSTARRRLQIAGFVGIFLLSYAVFLIITFPYDLLAMGILKRTQSSLPFEIAAAKITPRLPLGVKMTDVELGPFGAGQDVIPLDSLNINAALGKALRKRIDADAEARLGGGKVKLTYKGSDVAGDATIRITSLDFKSIKGLGNLMSWKISGKIGGKGDMRLDMLKLAENSGKLQLFSKNLRISNIMPKLIKEDFSFSNAEADIVLQRGGTLKINTISLQGKPCGFDLSGTIKLYPNNLIQSRLEIDLVLIPTPEFIESNPIISMLQKNDEGNYIGQIRGTLQSPVFP